MNRKVWPWSQVLRKIKKACVFESSKHSENVCGGFTWLCKGFRWVKHCILCWNVCVRDGKHTLLDTLSQSQCYARSKNSSSLATSEPPTLPAHRLDTKHLCFQRTQFKSPAPISHGFSKCSFLGLLAKEKVFFFLKSCFLAKLNMTIIPTNYSKKEIKTTKGRRWLSPIE